ncbi:MAG: hypothetical protein JWO52_6412 [Gammaproteobacteria bacterium]|nr:hypothetical protein [Gammaproteobacteria bacterium]
MEVQRDNTFAALTSFDPRLSSQCSPLPYTLRTIINGPVSVPKDPAIVPAQAAGSTCTCLQVNGRGVEKPRISPARPRLAATSILTRSVAGDAPLSSDLPRNIRLQLLALRLGCAGAVRTFNVPQLWAYRWSLHTVDLWSAVSSSLRKWSAAAASHQRSTFAHWAAFNPTT